MFEIVIFRAVHIISVIIWLGVIPADLLVRKIIRDKKGTESEKTLVSFWLKLTNLGGMIGATGVLVSGIFMSMIFNYGFFQFASGANHWLYTKQLIAVIVLILLGAVLIPTGVSVRKAVEKSSVENSPLSEETYVNIAKLGKTISAVNFLIVINLLLALTRNLM